MPDDRVKERLASKPFDEMIERAESLGFRPSELTTHANRIRRFLAGDALPSFAISDACRINNGGLNRIPGSLLGAGAEICGNYVAYVPAAGVASRYHKSLDASVVQTTTLWPKALLPCVKDGPSYLQMKAKEHAVMGTFAGESYIAGPGQAEAFLDNIRNNPLHEHRTHPRLIEQGPSLSTWRFLPDGQVVVDDQGRPSSVPAGHGALIETLDEIRESFPQASSLFIRNIDNVCGTNPVAIAHARSFLAFHDLIFGHVQSIRRSLSKLELDLAGESARQILDLTDKTQPKTSLDALKGVLTQVFHAVNPPDDIATLGKLFCRPVNTLGQVPNTGKDVGGTPVFAATPMGTLKLCLEVPHASPADRRKFLEDSSVATHFNPVFVAAEIPPQGNAPYMGVEHPFWLVADKTFMGHRVLYHESLLYEILGNSALANSVFVEIPRMLFNPHKSAQDAQNRRLGDWIAGL